MAKGHLVVVRSTVISEGFKGMWIPARIALDKDLSLVEKVSLSYIKGYSNGLSPCFAGNKVFAELCSCTEVTASRAIKRLKAYKLITAEYKKIDGRSKRVLWSKV